MGSSTAGAAEWQGDLLGDFVEAGYYGERPYFLQRDTEGNDEIFLYYFENRWRVWSSLGSTTMSMYIISSMNIPVNGEWVYWGGGKWNNEDTSFTLEYTSI